MIRLFTALVFLLYLLPAASSATIVRVDFAGVIEQVEDPAGILQPGFGLGTAFQGHFEFDPSTVLDSSTFPFLPPGLFLFPVMPFDIGGPSTLSGAVSVGAATRSLGRFGPLAEAIFIASTIPLEGTQTDIYFVPFEPFGSFPSAQAAESCSLVLADTSGTANPGGFYVPANLEPFDSATFGCSLSGGAVVVSPGGPNGSFSGTITRWVVTPEPSALVLVVSAAGLAAALRRPRA